MKLLPYLAGFLIGVLLTWLLFAKCGGDVKEVATVSVNVDSIITVNSALAYRIKSDSINYALYTLQDDSDRNAILEDKQSIEERGAARLKILALENLKLKTQVQLRDTVNGFATCIGLMHLYDSSIGLIGTYKKVIDSLQNNTDGRREVDSIRIVSLQQSVDSLQKQIDYLLAEIKELIASNENLKEQLTKALKGKKRSFWLGLLLGGGAGAGASNLYK